MLKIMTIFEFGSNGEAFTKEVYEIRKYKSYKKLGGF